MSEPIGVIQGVFETQGASQYGTEAVTQLQHALQCAALAENAGASASQVSAALLHDIGHLLDDGIVAESLEENLDDNHEHRGNGWLREHFGDAVAAPVRLHVLAKRYLCTTETEYADQLSPTSLKSFHDQGGAMTVEALKTFEAEPYYREALELRRWDDLAKDPNQLTPTLDHFVPQLRACLQS